MTPEAFANLAELVPDGLLLVRGDGQIVVANRGAAAWLGVSSDRAIGRMLSELAEDAQSVDEFLRRCRRSRQEVLGALRLTGEEGPARLFGRLLARGKVPAESTLLLRIPDEDTGFNRFAILNEKIEELGREISRRQAAEEQLRIQHDLATFGRDIGLALAEEADISDTLQRCAQLVVDHMQAAFARIWVVEPGEDELRLCASAGIYTHLDGPHSRIRLGQYKIGLIAQDQEPHLTNAVLGDERVHDQTWARRERMKAFAGYPLIVDGRTVGVMAMFARHPLSEGTLAAMASVANSIALGIERKRVEAELRRNAQILKAADKRKDEFLAMLAHELRNPLAPIGSGLELLQLESGENETLALMRQQVQHLSRLVDDLLDLSRIMRGRIELRSETLSFNDIVTHALSTVKAAMEQRGHHLTVSLSKEPVWLTADKVRLGQVVTNLLTNAAKYTPDGGQIHVATSRDAEYASLTVEDNGVGIAADFLPEIFELFAQADRGLDRSEGGLGIGLTLVRRLVRLHGGEIDLHSDGPGQGCRFTVRLPTTQPPKAQAVPPIAEHATMQQTWRILVVDDSVGSAKILGRLLGALGIQQVEMAHDGPSALETAKTFAPDIIFLDLGLPGLTGFQVAQRLRADARFQATKLIALTGYGAAEDRRKTHDVGFDLHLVKPVGLDQIKSALATHDGARPAC